MERGYVAELEEATVAAAEAEKQAAQTRELTAHRIAVADQTAEAILKAHGFATEKEASKLKVLTQHADAERRQQEQATAKSQAELERLTKKQEALSEKLAVQRESASQRVEQTRKAQEERLQQFDKDITAAMSSTSREIDEIRRGALQKVEHLAEERAALRKELAGSVQESELAGEAAVQQFALQGEADRWRSERTRDRVAVAMDLAGARSQATRTQAQQKIQKDATKKADLVKEIVKDGYIMQLESDAIVRKEQRMSAMTLLEAHDHCLQVQAELSVEVHAYNQRMHDLEVEMEARVREVEKGIREREEQRLEHFAKRHAAIEEQDGSLEQKRAACESELAEVEAELRLVQQDHEARSRELLAQSAEGSQAAEAAIRALETRGRETMVSMEASVKERLDKCAAQKKEIVERGLKEVAELEKKIADTIDSTKLGIEESAAKEDAILAANAATLAELRLQPAAVQAAADAASLANADAATEEQRQIETNAEELCSNARSVTHACRQEQDTLEALSAETWARVRAGCFELRRANLHEFSKRIARGEFDLPSEPLVAVA